MHPTPSFPICRTLQEASTRLEHRISLPMKGAWIRDLAFSTTPESRSITLASASDAVIKIWTITEASKEIATSGDDQLKVREQLFTLPAADGNKEFRMSLESSFTSHDAPINSLRC